MPALLGADYGQNREGENAAEIAELSKRTQSAPNAVLVDDVITINLAKIASPVDRLTSAAGNAKAVQVNGWRVVGASIVGDFTTKRAKSVKEVDEFGCVVRCPAGWTGADTCISYMDWAG